MQLCKLKDKDLFAAMKIIDGVLRHNEKMNLYNAFNNWRNRNHLLREQYLKALLIKQIKSAQNVKEKMSNEARLRAALLKWRTNLISMNYLDTIKQIRKGCKLFKLGLKKLHERDILNNIKDAGNQNRKTNILKNIIIKIIPELYKQKMKNAFDNWKNKLGDTQKMKEKIRKLFNDYINNSDKVHQGLFNKPKEDIINLFKDYDNKKKDAANKISKFVKGILKIPEAIKKMEINKKLNSIVNKTNHHIDDIKKIKFIRLFRQTQKERANQGATTIQRYFKKMYKRKLDKKNLIKDGLDKFILFVKRKCFNKIKDLSNNNHITIILKKCIHKKSENNNDLLRKKFNQWKDKIPLMKQIEAAIKIQSAYRKHDANIILKILKLRNLLLKNIHQNNENKNKAKLMALLRDWLHRALKTKNNEAANTIQKIYKKRLENNKNKQANNKLQNLFKNYVKHKLADVMKRLSRVLGGKGTVVYKTIQDILYRNPFDKLINNLRMTGRINKLKEIYPKIYNKLKEYYLPKALKKWKENTYDQTIKHAILLQKFLRDQYIKKLQKDKERRDLLLLEILNKKIKNNSFLLKK